MNVVKHTATAVAGTALGPVVATLLHTPNCWGRHRKFEGSDRVVILMSKVEIMRGSWMLNEDLERI